MKNIILATVVALTLTGAAAFTQISPVSSRAEVVVAKMSAMPRPYCAPSDPNGCGMGGIR